MRCWYSYYRALWFHCDLFWKMGFMQKTWAYPWRVQTHHFLVSNFFLAANVFAIIDIRNKAECATNSVTEAAHYKFLSISCILKWMSRRYSVNEHKYPCVRCQCFFYAGKASIMCFSWQTRKIAFIALNTRRIAALTLHAHFKSSARNASSLDVLSPILHVKTCTGS